MPQLDGLRGIAILWVILHNAALDNIGHSQSLLMDFLVLFGDSGWVGVQLFFVLSGFLITGILLNARHASNPFRTFYARRTLRIFPVYYAFLFLALIVLPGMGVLHWHNPHEQSWLYWLYLSNWGALFHQDASFPHLWSLAIEEQYYLLWPMLVIFLRKRTLALICLGLIFSAPLFRAWLVMHYDAEFAAQAMYTFTFARWDALAFGSLLALCLRSDRCLAWLQSYAARGFVVLGVGLLVQTAVLRNFTSQGVAGIFNQSTIALWFALLILVSLVPWQTPLARVRGFFRNGFLRWLGKYSYAIYLFHVPVKMFWFSHLAIAVKPDSPWQQLAVLAYNVVGISAIATLAAYLSWHLWEKHFLQLKRRFVLNKPAVAG